MNFNIGDIVGYIPDVNQGRTFPYKVVGIVPDTGWLSLEFYNQDDDRNGENCGGTYRPDDFVLLERTLGALNKGRGKRINYEI